MNNPLPQIIKESKILEYTNKKYNKKYDLKTTIVTDPYYRFGRVIEEVQSVFSHNGAKWLDLGCHHGQFLELVSKVLNYKTIGIDDWDLKSELPFTDCEYHKADLSDSNWTNLIEEGSIDVISALEVIEHMIDTVKFVNDCRTRLVDNGYLVLSTPNINSLRNRLLVPLGKYPAYLEYRNIIHHVRLFNVKKIVDLLEQNGYRVKKVCGVSFLPEKLLRYELCEKISKWLSKQLPSLCGQIIVIAQKAN